MARPTYNGRPWRMRAGVCWPADRSCASNTTKLYNAMDEGAYVDLKALHRELDEAVADCYG